MVELLQINVRPAGNGRFLFHAAAADDATGCALRLLTLPNATPPSGIPRSIWMLGLVSLCMDVSSELIHSLLPVFLVTVLGASALAVGLIEGAAPRPGPFSGFPPAYLSNCVTSW